MSENHYLALLELDAQIAELQAKRARHILDGYKGTLSDQSEDDEFDPVDAPPAAETPLAPAVADAVTWDAPDLSDTAADTEQPDEITAAVNAILDAAPLNGDTPAPQPEDPAPTGIENEPVSDGEAESRGESDLAAEAEPDAISIGEAAAAFVAKITPTTEGDAIEVLETAQAPAAEAETRGRFWPFGGVARGDA